jgi:ribose transport system ATP-binding protein
VSTNLLEIRGLNKRFGPTHANVDIDFTLKRGEIRGLIGENGSGKSTLISIIAGLYPRDSGAITLGGAEYSPRSPLDANAHKVSMVMQELGVVGTLPAGVNVFLGHTRQFTEAGVINLNALNKAATKVFERWGLPKVPLNRLTDGMMIEMRKIIELARALSVEPDVLLLDEITQSLSMNNRELLYELLTRLKDMGKSVVVVTHDVDELIRITDTITVLRDGRVVGSVESAATSADEIKLMMVGRRIEGDYYRSDLAPDYSDEVALRVDGLTVDGEITNVSFELHRGEILAFCGLSDSGIHSVGKAVYGLSKRLRGTVKLNSSELRSATDALRRNVAYVPKDRDNEALMIRDDILSNFVLPSLDTLKGALGYLAPQRLRALALKMTAKLSVKCTDINQVMDSLSGGNKQKVNLGRWLAKSPELLILDCPTRGVDVGVKAYIYSLMLEAKRSGAAILLISDELTEALGMADRLVVMKGGKITRVIRRDEDFTEQSVIAVMV